MDFVSSGGLNPVRVVIVVVVVVAAALGECKTKSKD